MVFQRRGVWLVFLLLFSSTIANSKTQTKPQQSCEIPANPGKGIKPPQVTSSPAPYFPTNAGAQKNRPYVVVLSVIVGTNGKPCDPQVQQSPGPEFDRAALDAIHDWRWKPATRDGTPVAVRIFVNVTFTTN